MSDSSSAPPPSDTTTAPTPTSTSTTNPPPPSSTSTTTQPSSPAQSSTTTGESTTQASNASQTTAPPQETTSSTTSTLTAPQTTVVQTTVVETSNGQAFTTVFETQSVIPSGATVTSGSGSSSGNNNQSSSSNTGAIVGGVVGGVAGLIAILLIVWGIMRWRRNRYNDVFDGNFDPDRLTRRPGAEVGGTLPNIPVDDDNPNQMAQLDDDGMGGRLNASTVGGGIVAPYPLYDSPSHPTHLTSPTSPSFPVAAPYAHPGGPNGSYPNNLNQMNQYWGGAGGPGRHPSPGPSLAATHTTGESPHSYHNLGPGAAAAAGAGLGVAGGLAAGSHSHGRPPSISSSSSGPGPNNGVMGVTGGGMTPGRLAKEREAYGMYHNQGPQSSQQPQFGAPGPATSGPSAWGAAANGQRRFSNTNSDGYPSVTSGSQYSQSGPGTFAGGPGSGGGGSADGSGRAGSGAYGGGMVVNNPDEDETHVQGYAGGWSEDARRMYLAGGPGHPAKGSPPLAPNRSGVLVHQDGGRVPQQQPQETPEEIPPTYDSLVLDSDEVRGGASGPASGAASGNASPNGGRAASPAQH